MTVRKNSSFEAILVQSGSSYEATSAGAGSGTLVAERGLIGCLVADAVEFKGLIAGGRGEEEALRDVDDCSGEDGGAAFTIGDRCL